MVLALSDDYLGNPVLLYELDGCLGFRFFVVIGLFFVSVLDTLAETTNRLECPHSFSRFPFDVGLFLWLMDCVPIPRLLLLLLPDEQLALS